MPTRREFLAGAFGAGAGAAGAELMGQKGRQSSAEQSGEAFRLKKQGELEQQASEMTALTERVGVLLGPLSEMLKKGPANNQQEWGKFNLDLGRLAEAAGNLRYLYINNAQPFSEMNEPIDAGGSVIPSREVNKANDAISKYESFFQALAAAYPEYGRDPEIMPLITGDDVMKG